MMNSFSVQHFLFVLVLWCARVDSHNNCNGNSDCVAGTWCRTECEFELSPVQSCSAVTLTTCESINPKGSCSEFRDIGEECTTVPTDILEGECQNDIFLCDPELTCQGSPFELLGDGECQERDCAELEVLTASSGIIKDGSWDFFREYQTQMQCTWKIEPNENSDFIIELEFVRLDTESCFGACSADENVAQPYCCDTINIYDGDRDGAQLLRSVSGNTLPNLIYSTGKSVTVEWNSDELVSKSGFEIHYRTIPPEDAGKRTNLESCADIKNMRYSTDDNGEFLVSETICPDLEDDCERHSWRQTPCSEIAKGGIQVIILESRTHGLDSGTWPLEGFLIPNQYPLDCSQSEVRIRGETGDPRDVIIDCNNHQCFDMLKGGATHLTLSLFDVTIRNGNTDDNGGLVIAGPSQTVILSNVILEGFSAKNGGAIASINADVFVCNSVISYSNAERDGGVIFSTSDGSLSEHVVRISDRGDGFDAIASENDIPIVNRVVFEGNTVTKVAAGKATNDFLGDGGAIYTQNVDLFVNHCTFESCKSEDGQGGSIYVDALENEIDVYDSTFTNSRAHTGGAIYVKVHKIKEDEPVNIDWNEFTDCQAGESYDESRQAFGGAIAFESDCVNTDHDRYDMKISGCKFSRCGANPLFKGTGGALSVSKGNVYIHNASFTESYGAYGGAVWIKDSKRASFDKVEMDSSHATDGGCVYLSNSDVSISKTEMRKCKATVFIGTNLLSSDDDELIMGRGGAFFGSNVHINAAELSVTDCESEYFGGCFYLESDGMHGKESHFRTLTAKHCESRYGGAFYLYFDKISLDSDSKVAHNDAEISGEDAFLFGNSEIDLDRNSPNLDVDVWPDSRRLMEKRESKQQHSYYVSASIGAGAVVFGVGLFIFYKRKKRSYGAIRTVEME